MSSLCGPGNSVELLAVLLSFHFLVSFVFMYKYAKEQNNKKDLKLEHLKLLQFLYNKS